MKSQRKFNNKFFKEIDINELENIVGKHFFNNDFLDYLNQTVELTNQFSIPLLIINSYDDNSIAIYDKKNKSLLLTIDSNEYSECFCKPYAIMDKLSLLILENYRHELDNNIYKAGTNNVIDELFYLNELPDNEKLNNYFYRLSLIFIHQFSLDINKTKIMYYDEEKVIIDGLKNEFILNKQNKLEEQEVIYMVNFKTNSEIISIVKIFENNVKETFYINLNDFFLQEKSLLFNVL